MRDNVIEKKTKAFALRCVRVYRYVAETHREFVLSKQVLRSGTSIGANVAEAIYAQSPADFVSKLNIALKEARETIYWIELLMENGFIEGKAAFQLHGECVEIIKILTAIVNTTKRNIKNRQQPNSKKHY